MSSPSRVITATDASSSKCPSRRHRHRTDPGDLAPFARLDVPSHERGGVDHGTDLDGLAGPVAGKRNERVGRVRGARLTPPGPAGVPEDPLEMPVPGRAEARTGVGSQARLEAVGTVGIGPLVCAAFDVQATGPRGVVGLRTCADLAAPVAEALHTRPGRGLQQCGLGRGIGARCARDLGGLRGGELPGPERLIGLGQVLERTRRLERAAGGADRLARRLGDPVRGAAMPALAPCVGLLDATSAERFDRRTDPLAAGCDLDKRGRGASVEAARIERT
jgi:hypothetical protein